MPPHLPRRNALDFCATERPSSWSGASSGQRTGDEKGTGVTVYGWHSSLKKGVKSLQEVCEVCIFILPSSPVGINNSVRTGIGDGRMCDMSPRNSSGPPKIVPKLDLLPLPASASLQKCAAMLLLHSCCAFKELLTT